MAFVSSLIDVGLGVLGVIMGGSWVGVRVGEWGGGKGRGKGHVMLDTMGRLHQVQSCFRYTLFDRPDINVQADWEFF